MNAMETGRSSRMMRRTSSSIARRSSSVSARSNGKSKRRPSGVDERAGLAGALADHVPQRAVEQVRARVVAHRVGAPLGVDLGADRLADAQPAAQGAAMDDEPAERLLGVLDVEEDAAAARLAEDAAVADLAAALGVERRPVEDDLGRAVAGQLVELDARRAGSRPRGPRRVVVS